MERKRMAGPKDRETRGFAENGKFAESGNYAGIGRYAESMQFEKDRKLTETERFAENGKIAEAGKFAGDRNRNDGHAPAGRFGRVAHRTVQHNIENERIRPAGKVWTTEKLRRAEEIRIAEGVRRAAEEARRTAVDSRAAEEARRTEAEPRTAAASPRTKADHWTAMNPRAAAANRAAQIVRTARPAWRKASRRLAAAASAAARKLAGAIRRRPAAILAGAWAAMLMGAALTIPLLLVSPAGAPEGNLGTTGAHHLEDAWQIPPAAGDNPVPEPVVPVYISAEQQVRSVPLERYVRGVVAAEMPLEFELEALKAQALAARTYIVQRMVTGNVDGIPEGVDAWVTDTVMHQAYLTEERLAEKLSGGAEAEEKLAKLNQAIAETRGQIITYDGEPIVAAFFSTSNGYTENSEEYWQTALPYLRSVESPWEAKLSPKFRTTVTIPVAEARRKLGLSGKVAVSASGGGKTSATATASASVNDISANDSVPMSLKVLERTEGRRIKTINIDGRNFTGREVREKLGLPSSEFSWRIGNGSITFTAYGDGHGVGMSQWGAQGMALEGRKAEHIITHYYTGVRVEDFDYRRLKL